MNRARIFSLISITWLVGVGVGELITPTFFILYVVVLGVSLSLLVAYSIRYRIFVIILFMFLFGVIYSNIRSHSPSEHSIDSFNGSQVMFTGIVSLPPDVRDTHQKVTLTKISIASKKYSGKLLLLTSLDRSIGYNESLTIECLLEAPQPIEDFAYDKYLSRFEIYSICAFPKEFHNTPSTSRNVLSYLYSFGGYLDKRIEKSIPEPESSLLKGILLGDKKGLGDELTDVFRRTGLSHIVALSGYNISILVGLFLSIGPHLYLSRRMLFIVISFAIVGFVIMTGSSPSVIRAGIMGWIILLAYESRRPPHALNILLAVAIGMIIVNPKILLWDVGWQLSFFATYAMIAIVPHLQYHVRNLPQLFGIRDAALVTLSAVTITSPLVIWHFQGISLVAVVANILVVPVIPIVMSFGLVTALAGSNFVLSYVWSVPMWFALHYIIEVSEFLAHLPFAYRSILRESGIAIGVIIFTLFIYYKKKYARKAT
jgi:competence protein ComEC